MRRALLGIAATLALCTACTEGRVFHHYNHTPLAGWEKTDELTYDVPKLAATGRYGIDLGLRINGLFPFTSLTLIVEQTVYPSREQRTDTLNCKLTDRNGTVKGQGVTYYQYHFHVSQLPLHRDDSLHITVKHNMQREILPGIADVGIAISKL